LIGKVLDEQLKYWIGLSLIDGVGPANAKKIVAFCGGIEGVFSEEVRGVNKVKVPEFLKDKLKRSELLERADAELEFIAKNGIEPIAFFDEKYPTRMQQCGDSPIIIYTKGNIDLNARKVLSVVGTRKASTYGKKVCEELVEALAKHNVLIVSGLAYGIDICAHRAALRNGLDTVAVLAHGFDHLYPGAHRKDARKITEQGALVTEFASDSHFHPSNFPSRNRIVAGMADATLVIESAKKGGSLITADIANSYNRDVFAVPGRLGDSVSEGCNKLIKTSRAHLVQSAWDIEYVMGWKVKEEPKQVQKQLFIDLSNEEKLLVDILQEKGHVSIDNIAITAKLPMSQTSVLLLNLEFNGVVRSMPGKVYALN
jgi:DNA processing protein